MSIKQISDEKNLRDKRIILRLDLNEPIDDAGKLLDDFRILAALPTIKEFWKNGNKLILVSHLGRPEGRAVGKLSLRPVAMRLAELLQAKFVETSNQLPDYAVRHLIFYTGNVADNQTRDILSKQLPKDIVLLENIRFDYGEESSDESFAKHLAALGDVFVNEAFSVSHRNAASITALPELLPGYAGPLLAKETSALDVLLSGRYKKPFILMMGGIKITDKSQTLMNLGKFADKILIGGGLANLFLAAQGYDVDVQDDKASISIAKQILLNYKSKIVLPVDATCYSANKRTGSKVVVKKIPDITKLDKVYDIGPATILEFTKILQTAGTICWNGPMGYFEEKPYRAGTLSMAKVVGGLGKRKAYVVAGGGETVAAIRQSGQLDHLDHVSTGGGAMLEYLAGSKLPGIEVLK